jgi:hypothetical protein
VPGSAGPWMWAAVCMVVRFVKLSVILADSPSGASTMVLEPAAGVFAAPSGVRVARKIDALAGGCGLPASTKPGPREARVPLAILTGPFMSQTCIWPLVWCRQRMSDLLSPL